MGTRQPHRGQNFFLEVCKFSAFDEKYYLHSGNIYNLDHLGRFFFTSW